jgi:hypothetical protein
MSFDHWIGSAGVLIAFGVLCATIYKIRQSDWKEINKQIQSNAIELAAFKLQVAQLHPTASDLIQVEARLSASLDRLADRIDSFLERASR